MATSSSDVYYEGDAVPFINNVSTTCKEQNQDERNTYKGSVSVAESTSDNDTTGSDSSESESESNVGEPPGQQPILQHSRPYYVNMNNVQGMVNIGSTYTSCNYGGGNVVMMSNVINTSGRKFFVNSEDGPQDETEQFISKDILESSLSLSVQNKYLVAESIGEKYVKMARFLKGAGFKTSDIDNISFQNKDYGRVEIVIAVLERWGERAPEYATIGNLAVALQKVGRVDIANQLSLDTADLKCDD